MKYENFEQSAKACKPDIISEALSTVHEQERFPFMGFDIPISDKDRFSTRAGMLRQLKDFQGPMGLVYYISESSNGFQKIAFKKSR